MSNGVVEEWPYARQHLAIIFPPNRCSSGTRPAHHDFWAIPDEVRAAVSNLIDNAGESHSGRQ